MVQGGRRASEEGHESARGQESNRHRVGARGALPLLRQLRAMTVQGRGTRWLGYASWGDDSEERQLG